MFAKVRVGEANKEIIINLRHVVKAEYEESSASQASVELYFSTGETLQLQEEEGRRILDALKSQIGVY